MCPMGMLSCLCFSSIYVIFELNEHIDVHSCMADQIKNLIGQLST